MSKTCILIYTFPEEEPEPESRTIDCVFMYERDIEVNTVCIYAVS